MIFKKIFFNQKKKIDNIFIVCSFNQLQRSVFLINKLSIKNSLLIFIIKKNNLNQYKHCKEKYKYQKIHPLFLSNHPNRVRLLKYIYFSLLAKVASIFIKNKNIYLFNHYGYSALTAEYLQKKNHINIIEDGLFNYTPIKIPHKKKYFFKKIESIFLGYHSFDNYYCTYPDIAKKFIKAKKFIQYIPFEMKNSLQGRRIAIFINQNYGVETEYHTRSIISFLSTLENVDEIYIKLHPNDTKPTQESFKSKLINDERIKLIENNFLKIEEFISEKKPKYVISINSTVLIYVPLLCSTSKSISIYNWYIKHTNLSNESLKKIKKDNYALLNFNFIIKS